MKEAPATTGIRAYLVIAAACLAYTLVLQLHGDNVQPLEVTISSAPDAVLVGSTNRFRAMISGGVAPYDCAWYCDSSLILTSFGNATAHELSYIAPNDPKQATMCFAVTDSKPENPQFKQTFRDFWQVKFDFDLDANYDGLIDDNDEDLETTQGGLIAQNIDDDNQNGVPDRSESPVQNENDLCKVAILLTPATIAGSSLTLSATAGGNKVQVWSSDTKSGTLFTFPYTWSPGTQPQYVYTEGFTPSGSKRDITLKLTLTKGNSSFNDEIKLGVVKVAFTSRSDTAYGYDDGSLAYPTPDPASYSPQKYTWASVENANAQTKVDANITPQAYANSVYFTVDDTAKAACSPAQATASPQSLTLTGKGSLPKTQTFVRANLGASSGPLVTRLNLAVYKQAVYNAEFHKVRSATLVPAGTTWPQFKNGANVFLNGGVARLDGASASTLTLEYDVNANGYLDIVGIDGGPEWLAIKMAVNPTAGNEYFLHIKPSILLAQGVVAAGVRVTGGNPNCEIIVISDNVTSKAAVSAHEVLHGLGLDDIGPLGQNTQNLMYFQDGITYHLGYFAVQRYYFSGTENQWEIISR